MLSSWIGQDRASAATTSNMSMLLRFLSRVVPLLLRLGFMLTLGGMGAEEGMTMLHRGAFSHQLTLVGTDGSQEQLAVTDEDVLYLGLTVDESECQRQVCALSYSWFTKLIPHLGRLVLQSYFYVCNHRWRP